MEEAGKASTSAVHKATLAAFENELLKEHLLPQARSQLKEAWSAYISKHSAHSSAGPSANPSNLKVAGRYSFGIAPWGYW